MSIIDMHVHLENRSPCSILSEKGLFNNLSKKIDGICITDHNILEPLPHLFKSKIMVFFGVEITCDSGDILAYGIKSLPSKRNDARAVIKFVHERGGVAIAAHPYSNRHNSFRDKVLDLEFDAIEINGAMEHHCNESAKNAAKKMGIPTTGGSDSHSVNQLNTLATAFDASIHSLSDVIKAVKKKKCHAIRIS